MPPSIACILLRHAIAQVRRCRMHTEGCHTCGTCRPASSGRSNQSGDPHSCSQSEEQLSTQCNTLMCSSDDQLVLCYLSFDVTILLHNELVALPGRRHTSMHDRLPQQQHADDDTSLGRRCQMLRFDGWGELQRSARCVWYHFLYAGCALPRPFKMNGSSLAWYLPHN